MNSFWADYRGSLRRAVHWRPGIPLWTGILLTGVIAGDTGSIVFAALAGKFMSPWWLLLLVTIPGWITDTGIIGGFVVSSVERFGRYLSQRGR